jgi:hypothetical protein
MKKEALLLLTFILLMPIVAAQVDITSKPIKEDFIMDFNDPATFELTIINLGELETFEVYSLADVQLSKLDKFTIDSGDSKIIMLNITPRNSLRNKVAYLPIRIKLKDSQNNAYEAVASINMVWLNDGAFEITAGNINPNSQELEIIIENKLGIEFNNVDITLESVFTDYDEKFSISPYETKKIKVPIASENLRGLNAGPYLLNMQLLIGESHVDLEQVIKFLEQENIDVTDSDEGVFIRRQEFNRKNLGNVRKDISISIEKNRIASFFTTYAIAPTTTNEEGLIKTYTWEKQLIPNEELNVIVKTNYIYPILIILLLVTVIVFYIRYVRKDITIKKTVSFVKTKGGESLVKLYNKFGAIHPDKIDLHNKRMEWNIEKLGKGEERIFTYIIYSKIGVVGKFELPEAHAFYEKEGKIKEALSNRSFYINEPGN